MLLAAYRARAFGVIHGCAEGEAQHAAHLVVEFLCSHFAFPDKVEIRGCHIVIVVGVAGAVRQAVGPAAELEVQPVGDCLTGVVGSAPVAYHGAVESPLAFENVVEQVLVVAGVLVFVIIVCSHYRPRPAFLHGRFKRRQVNLVESAVVHHGIGSVAVYLVVVQRVVLHAGCHAECLKVLHIRHYHSGGKQRVFAHVFKVASVEGGAVYVNAGAEQHVLASVAGFLADRGAVECRHVGIPCGGEAGKSGESHAGVIGPAGLVPLVPQHFGAYAVRAVGGP